MGLDRRHRHHAQVAVVTRQIQTKGASMLSNQIAVLWTYLRARTGSILRLDETGSVVETVIITAIFAALAIAVGAIIVAKITSKTNSINLG
jgi:hypothetical protein